MHDLIIETQNLTFSFAKNRPILRNVNLRVEEGSIYGFLGPNGAGKTTTLRVLLGLLNRRTDFIKIFGRFIDDYSTYIFSNIGALIETPSLYEHLTGLDNLRVVAKIKNISTNKIREALKTVNLISARNITVKKYSLGMKQRLGLALALLSEPKLLILDEPANGLDPNGINEIRQLLIQLNKTLGTTILISSHQLSEIEKMVTHLGIIHKGCLVFQGRIGDLNALNKDKSLLVIETSDNNKARNVLERKYAVRLNSENKLELGFESRQQCAYICNSLVHEGLDVYQLRTEDSSLEKIYLELTND